MQAFWQLRTGGPKLASHRTQATEFACSVSQDAVFEQLELHVKMHKPATDSDFFKASLSKNLYWLGSHMFFSTFLDNFLG